MNIKVGTNLDVKSEAFLRAVYESGGTAKTTEIRDRTGLSQKERNYRFEKLDQMGYIDTGYANSGTSRRDPKEATLTDDGMAIVEEGISPEAREWVLENEVTEKVERLEQRIDMLENQTSQTHNRLKSLEKFRDRLASLMFDSEN
ncbi:hypothetical protein OB920_13310 [Halobacteria archaeon HArc-gm2]|nr:hypothetical protein [Halobacteria archaeon HArc-gm2]